MGLFIPTYFSPISQYAAIMHSDSLVFEVEDHFQKQTYRNRCYIYGNNGKQLLNIPVLHPKTSERRKTKEMLVGKSGWQKQHYTTLETVYNNSPFFEFYKDDLQVIFMKKYTFLLDVTIDTFIFINKALELAKKFTLSNAYELNPKEEFRSLANAKQQVDYNFEPYTQVFDNRYGFLKNLSILDLLFMEGPNSITFLEKINIT